MLDATAAKVTASDPHAAARTGYAGFWAAAAAAADASALVPLDRWDVDAGYAPAPDPSRMTTYCRTAGFVQGMADFDAGAFRLSGAEAGAMDPQQRLLLEAAALALADAGAGPERISVGAFLDSFNVA